MKKRYDHAISFNVSLNSDNEEPTSKEILDKLQKALLELDETNILDAIEIFDSYDRGEND